MDTTQLLRLLFAFVFVMALMGILGVIMRRLNEKQLRGRSEKRLQLVETMPLDARRKLVLLRRDHIEHLVILGPQGETVVEQGIESRQDKQP